MPNHLQSVGKAIMALIGEGRPILLVWFVAGLRTSEGAWEMISLMFCFFQKLCFLGTFCDGRYTHRLVICALQAVKQRDLFSSLRWHIVDGVLRSMLAFNSRFLAHLLLACTASFSSRNVVLCSSLYLVNSVSLSLTEHLAALEAWSPLQVTQ